MQLSIEKTWDGKPIDSNELVNIKLELRDDFLCINVLAPFHGDEAPAAPVGPTAELWKYEVIEVFIVGEDSRYTEIELSPHGHHLVLQLSAPRVVERALIPIEFDVEFQEDKWLGCARVPLSILPAKPQYLNAFAIHGEIERRYLCWTPLPGPEPDFHQPHRFEKHSIEGL
jgi:hypothetical protein